MTVKPDIRGVLDADTYANGDPGTFGLPLEQYAYLRNDEPCYLHEFDDPMLIDRAWVISRNADIWAVDRNPELYAADRGGVNMWKVTPLDRRTGGKPAMLTMDGAKHRSHRAVMAAAFTPRMAKSLEAKFRSYAANIVDAALEKGTVDFVRDIAHVMPMEALGDVVGVPHDDRVKFFEWVDTFAAPFDTRITPSFEHVANAIGGIMNYALELAEIKRKDPGDDVITALVQAPEVVSQDELQGNIALLASGAAESTRSALSHGMHALMHNPEQMAYLRDRASDIPDVAIQEIVRVAAPFTHLVRTATRDHEVHGKEIREGDVVLMLFAAGNFDERAFDEPNVFNLARDKNPHVSFGRGPHQCLGKHVVSMEMRILLEELLQRTRDIKPAGDIVYVRDAYSRGVYQLPVTLTPA
jgi:cytochrome P450